MTTPRTPRGDGRRPSPSRCRGLVALLFVTALVALTGCVTVPTSGPVVKAGGEAPGCLKCVDVDVAPPSVGDDPKQIVDGFLLAMSNYQPNYAVAKQFLTTSAAEKWSPEESTSIYYGTTTSTGADSVSLDAELVGTLDRSRTFTARAQKLDVDFRLVQESGQWRISAPPNGLLVAQYSFANFYRPYNVYFIGNGRTLAPDPVYLPPRVNEASVLVQSLLAGASAWLKPAVTSAIPPKTTLKVAVTVRDGVAEVALSDTIVPLNGEQRSLMAAQVLYTLMQADGVQRVLFTVDQQPFRIPGADPDDFTVSLDDLSDTVAPIPYNATEAYYGVAADGVKVIDARSETVGVEAAPGPFGTDAYDISSLAVSVSNTTLAAVTDGGTVLREQSGDAVSTVLSGVTGLLRPQYSRYDELWAIGRHKGRQQLWLRDAAKARPVNTPVLGAGEVTAFKISPDGVRIALIRKVGDQTQLGVARIIRGDTVSVDGWRQIDTQISSTEALTRLVDVAWSDPTTLVVLGAMTKEGQVSPYRVSQDAYRISSMGQAERWDAEEVAVSVSNANNIVVVGRSGQSWRDDGSQRWPTFVGKLRAVALPG